MNGQTVSKALIPLPAGATAVYTSGPTLRYFRHPDWLGSSRFASTPARTMYSDLAYAPFGETYAEAGTPDRSFTGQNQDTVPDHTAGLYDFLYREYAQYGRWISPDPAGLAAVDIANPQSWNRYVYVLNNPLARVDPLGLCDLVYFEGAEDYPERGNPVGTWGCEHAEEDAEDSDSPLPSSRSGPGFAEDFITLGPGVRIPIRRLRGWVPSVHILWRPANSGTATGTKPTIGYSTTVIFPLLYALGPAVTITVVPGQNLRCIAPGIGASVGRTFSAGPIVGDSKTIKGTLERASVSAGYQFTPWAGAGGSGNSSGVVSGNTVGVPGASATLTYGFCF